MGIPRLDNLIGNIYYKVLRWGVTITVMIKRIEKLNDHLPALIRLKEANHILLSLLQEQCEEEREPEDPVG